MLTYLLALAVALGSLGLYLSAFFYPEIYRRGDLILSGVGMFYALVLWICGDRIRGGILLGQIASVTLIGWFAYQALTARLGYTPSTAELQGKLNDALKSEKAAGLVNQGKQLFATLRGRAQTLTTKAPAEAPSEPYQPLKREDFGNPAVSTESGSKPNVQGALDSAKSAIGGLFKKPAKNTSTYVRKDFREDPDEIGYEEDAIESEQAVETQSVPVNRSGAAESTIPADEVMQEELDYEAHHPQAVPPHPPSPDLVEAALADAEEKDIPADPPEPEK